MRHFHFAFGFEDVRDLGETRFKRNGVTMIDIDTLSKHRRFATPAPVLALAFTLLLLAGCGDQVIVEGVNVSDGALVGDSVIDNPADAEGIAAGEPYAIGNPYEEAEEGEKNMGPNAPGYIPETID
jgi:hypothetical protein